LRVPPLDQRHFDCDALAEPEHDHALDMEKTGVSHVVMAFNGLANLEHLSLSARAAWGVVGPSGTTGRMPVRVRGCTGTTLLDHGFCTGMLADLVRDGLATARLESVRTGKRKIAVARVRITDAGQIALEGAAESG